MALEGRLASPFCTKARRGDLPTDILEPTLFSGISAFRVGAKSYWTGTQPNLWLAKPTGSPLAKGVTHDKENYNQAARTLAYMAQLLSFAERQPISPTRVGFYVIAPEYKSKGAFLQNQSSLITLKEP